MSILIVDDLLFNLKHLEALLNYEGYQDILTAQSAVEAYKILEQNSSSGAQDIDLILMDIIMPDINGIEACRTIKSNELIADISIIMITATTEKKEVELAFSAGAMDYITKPFDRIELIARVRSALRLKHEIDWRKARESQLEEVTLQLKELNETLRKISFRDGLTGIANRRYFDEIYQKEFQRAKRNKTSLLLIMLDIDYFKLYNDSYGHLQGDDCLKLIAITIKNTLKRSSDFVARYGGEEFIVILPDTNKEGGILKAEEIRLAVETLRIPHLASKCCDIVTVSLGVASMEPGKDISPEMLIQQADSALYLSKETGRNKVSS
ncbi:MAG: diguanylate cyclase [Peptococcaceae bacterium]|nr:diguanylate cyclase [Peptococcaceae bacterium]